MITRETIIHPIPTGLTAIQVAAQSYKKWMGDVSLEEDIAHYLAYGLVLSSPTCFALMKAVEEPKSKEPAWFIRMAVGSVEEMLYHVRPYGLQKICFCRRNDGRLRTYSLERMMRFT